MPDLLSWLSSLPPPERDAAVEHYLGIAAPLPSPAPPGDHLVGYHPSGVAAIVRALADVPVTDGDVVIDLGAGLGKVVMLARLLTGARARGIEIQAGLVDQARAAASRLGVDVQFTRADAREANLEDGTVFFLYAPFTGPVLAEVLRRLHSIARRHPIVVCALGIDLDRVAPWLAPRPTDAFWLTIYDSVVPGVRPRAALAGTMPALSAQHIRKAFGSQVVLDDATFALARGERVGLIGANGAGKSTLAKILAGVESADAGTVSVRRGLTVRYLAQEPELDPGASARGVVQEALTAWTAASTRHAEVTAELGQQGRSDYAALIEQQAELDDAISRLGGWERGHEALGFLDRLGVRDVDAPCGSRSGGERRRIALAQLLVASPDIAILDEPTNHLDADTAEWLEGYLDREFKGALVLVTHDRYFLDAIAQRIIELERGKPVSYAGSYGAYLDKKAELLAHEERVEQNRQNILRREREWLARGPKARSTKQKARIQRAVALEQRGPATAGRPGEVSMMTTVAPRHGKTILDLRALQVAAAEGAPPLNSPFDLIVTAGERIGIVGPNGVGKTTLMRAILAAVEEQRHGERAPGPAPAVTGEIVVGKNTRVAYLDQARAKLDDHKSIFDDVRGEGGSVVVNLGLRGGEAMDLRSYLELFLFDSHKQRQKVGSLSGGERARVALAKVLREGANLLMFDEPTNDLDLPTLAALEEMLEGYDGSVLVVTHDRAFLDRVATAILAFEVASDGGAPARVTRYAGGYQDYLQQRGQRPVPATAPAQIRTSSSPPKSDTKSKAGLTHAERLELEGIVDAVDAAEKAVAAVETLLGDPSLYTHRGHEVSALQARLAAARAGVAALASRWEMLEAKKSS